ncbi:acyl-CoA-like ligand-binding transcription factor [Actinomadura opuntiae]|uniref:acyl-CoA-like ligand-binding transcription factor n=1 Tax=Actinomadura sp. OS1-43 TaxID=604315 RepID=UPI00255A7C54|nr:TetR family transcriptional regulator [Actinomadura sp. OS1-43]MDL4816181.1 TetR family transcriptional regulator [Actinomadura sp. OS1-43]
MSTRETPAKAHGLRERKKAKTRLAIRRAAFRLFAEQGYEATTVDQIAEAAEVSPSTFFRYFPAKEDVILSDEYDSALVEALAARPADEPVVQSIRHSMTESFGRVLEADREELFTRVRLSFTDPGIRARAMDEQLRNQDAVAAAIAERTGRDAADLEVRCAAAALIAVSMTVMRHWVEAGGSEDLVALYDHHLGILFEGLRI